ncbi:MAG: GtrA family protein [Clostridia bacterium]|nr:GtrA family protein [Clostridia bacterium]
MNKLKDFFKKFLDIKALKFLAVGVLNTVVGMGIMLFLSAMFNKFTPEFAAHKLFTLGTTVYTASYLISSIVNYIAGGVLSYFLNKYWTFKNKSRSKDVVLKFIATVLICYIIAYLGAKPLTEVMLKNAAIADKWKEFIALIIGAGLYTVLNYFGQRFFAFAERKKNGQPASGSEEFTDNSSAEMQAEAEVAAVLVEDENVTATVGDETPQSVDKIEN